jgi:predicted nucleotidyltransferase
MDAGSSSADLERQLRAFFEEHARGLVCAYLFGSRARGTAGPHSDVDVGVLFEEDPPPTLAGLPLELEAELESRLGLPVQVIALNQAPADLVHRVLRDGRLVLETDRSRRIRFEVRRRNEFFDLQPILQEYRRARGGSGP